MKKAIFTSALVGVVLSVRALEGVVQIHDPSTIVEDNGVYYTYGTGGLPALFSDDGWNWERGRAAYQDLPGGRAGSDVLELGGGNSWAPDIIKLGDTFYMYYSAPATQPRSAVGMMYSKSLDPESPDYKWEDGGAVAWSDGVEDSYAIDPGVLLDPTSGRLWMTYGSYFGYISLVELNPENGKRLDPDSEPVNIAINCEASIMIYHEGWYYLLATHGSCCAGANSGYNIRMGRSRQVSGPFIDNMGIDMLMGGGKLFIGSESRNIGPGHFGLIDQEEGIQKFSIHWEADLDRGGASVLDIRPLLWKDGWPVAGKNFVGGDYRIHSVRTGTDLELAVEGVPVGGRRGRSGFGGRGRGRGGFGGRGGLGGRGGGEVTPIPAQDVAEVSANWPEGEVGIRMANYMSQAQQKWTVTPVADAGGYLGSPYFRISLTSTERVLAATPDDELVALSEFTGGAEQLWKIEQLTDGNWRVVPKSSEESGEPVALSAIGSSFATLSRFDPESEKHRWKFEQP